MNNAIFLFEISVTPAMLIQVSEANGTKNIFVTKNLYKIVLDIFSEL